MPIKELQLMKELRMISEKETELDKRAIMEDRVRKASKRWF
jgi:hypothetical protein